MMKLFFMLKMEHIKKFNDLDKLINEAWCSLNNPEVALLKANRAEKIIIKLYNSGYGNTTQLRDLAGELSIIYECFNINYQYPYGEAK